MNIGEYLVHMVLEAEDAVLLTNQLEEFLRYIKLIIMQMGCVYVD